MKLKKNVAPKLKYPLHSRLYFNCYADVNTYPRPPFVAHISLGVALMVSDIAKYGFIYFSEGDIGLL